MTRAELVARFKRFFRFRPTFSLHSEWLENHMHNESKEFFMVQNNNFVHGGVKSDVQFRVQNFGRKWDVPGHVTDVREYYRVKERYCRCYYYDVPLLCPVEADTRLFLRTMYGDGFMTPMNCKDVKACAAAEAMQKAEEQ